MNSSLHLELLLPRLLVLVSLEIGSISFVTNSIKLLRASRKEINPEEKELLKEKSEQYHFYAGLCTFAQIFFFLWYETLQNNF